VNFEFFLTCPITTASLERGFSKLKIIENRLRTTQGQDRLEALMFLGIEKDIATHVNIPDLVSTFAGKADRRLLLK